MPSDQVVIQMLDIGFPVRPRNLSILIVVGDKFDGLFQEWAIVLVKKVRVPVWLTSNDLLDFLQLLANLCDSVWEISE